MNKTQILLIERLEGKHGTGNIKQGWSKYGDSIRIQNFREIDQACKLAEKYPDKYQVKSLAFKLYDFKKVG